VSQHANAVLVRRLFAAFEALDIARVNDIIAEDAVWHFPGRRGALAGDHAGRDTILRLLVNVGVLTARTFRLQLGDVTASERGAVALFTGTATRPDGRILHNPTALWIDIRHGKVVELWEYVWDLEHVEDFWA
jgi:ketosteroid isomerase-like protein